MKTLFSKKKTGTNIKQQTKQQVTGYQLEYIFEKELWYLGNAPVVFLFTKLKEELCAKFLPRE